MTNDLVDGDVVSDHDQISEANVTVLERDGYKIHLIGTAHVSDESARQVEALIESIKPSVVIIELCNSRRAILNMKEATSLNDQEIDQEIEIPKEPSFVSQLMKALTAQSRLMMHQLEN